LRFGFTPRERFIDIVTDRIHGSSLTDAAFARVFPHLDMTEPSRDEGVACLAAVFPWAKSVLATSHSLRLDALKAAHPFALAVPLAIEANEAFPLAFIIGPSEKAELYEHFATFIKRLGCEDYGHLPVLSDAGTGLQRSVRGCDERGELRHPLTSCAVGRSERMPAQGL
jgi:hypothetical protein